MTKEELEQKAYEYAIKEIPFIECITQNDLEVLVQQAYITGAEPREKQIQIDAEHIIALHKQNGELTDKVNNLEEKLANADYQLEGRDNEIRELEAQTFFLKDSLDQEVELHQHAEDYIKSLEAQIEKMKCCGNCENRYEQEECKDCHNYSKWKFKQAEQFYEEIVE